MSNNKIISPAKRVTTINGPRVTTINGPRVTPEPQVYSELNNRLSGKKTESLYVVVHSVDTEKHPDVISIFSCTLNERGAVIAVDKTVPSL